VYGAFVLNIGKKRTILRIKRLNKAYRLLNMYIQT